MSSIEKMGVNPHSTTASNLAAEKLGKQGSSAFRIATGAALTTAILAGAYLGSQYLFTTNNTGMIVHPTANLQPTCASITSTGLMIHPTANNEQSYPFERPVLQPTTPIDFGAIAQRVASYLSLPKVLQHAVALTPCETAPAPSAFKFDLPVVDAIDPSLEGVGGFITRPYSPRTRQVFQQDHSNMNFNFTEAFAKLAINSQEAFSFIGDKASHGAQQVGMLLSIGSEKTLAVLDGLKNLAISFGKTFEALFNPNSCNNLNRIYKSEYTNPAVKERVLREMKLARC